MGRKWQRAGLVAKRWRRDIAAMGLTRAEKRALRMAYEVSETTPGDSVIASQFFSRESTLKSLHDKGLLIWTAHRGGQYHLTLRAIQVASHL
jgi:hypothetical protein